jgi:hypothetical protein
MELSAFIKNYDARLESHAMPKKLWKVHVPLNLRYPGTKSFEVAAIDEIVEERLEPTTTNSPADVRVYRLHKEHNDFQSFIVSRSELDANTKPVSESGQG